MADGPRTSAKSETQARSAAVETCSTAGAAARGILAAREHGGTHGVGVRTACGALCLLLYIAAGGRAAEMDERWVYVSTNLLFDQNVDALVALIGQADDAGATHILLSDYQTGFMGDMPPRYFSNVARIKQAAADKKITVCPAIFPIGSSGRYLYHNPNLADGIPVRKMRFVVRDGAAKADGSQVPHISNARFEDAAQGAPGDWKVVAPSQDEQAGSLVTVDTAVKHGGAAALRVTAPGATSDGANPRTGAGQVVRVEPFHAYTLTVWLKTEGIAPERHPVQVFGARDGRQLSFSYFMKDPLLHWPPQNASLVPPVAGTGKGPWAGGYTDLGIQPTGDWAQYRVAFNSLDYPEIEIFAGFSRRNSGAMWFDDFEIKPAGLLNVLRRDLTPLTVTDEEGAVTYVETLDYKRVEDPMLGVAATRGDFMAVSRGTFDVWHEPPPIRLTEKSRIKEGQTLLVSFYVPGIIYVKQQVTVSLDDPAVFDLMDREMKWAATVWNAPCYFMSYDEIRSCGWEEQPGGERLTPGELLARHVSRATEIIRKYAPQARVYVWSDMFDPYHNARDLGEGEYYFLVNGSWHGSWEGLPRDIVVFKWGSGMPIRQSAEWFAARGHRLVLSGFPADKWLAETEGLPGIVGISYTVWDSDYSGMEEFFRQVHEWKGAATAVGAEVHTGEE